MRTFLFTVAVALAAFLAAGCSSSFRAGGNRGGVSAGAAVGPAGPVIVEGAAPVYRGPAR